MSPNSFAEIAMGNNNFIVCRLICVQVCRYKHDARKMDLKCQRHSNKSQNIYAFSAFCDGEFFRISVGKTREKMICTDSLPQFVCRVCIKLKRLTYYIRYIQELQLNPWVKSQKNVHLWQRERVRDQVLSVTHSLSQKLVERQLWKACNFSASTALSDKFIAALGFEMLFGVQVFIVWNHTFPSTQMGISNQQIHAEWEWETRTKKQFCAMKWDNYAKAFRNNGSSTNVQIK